MEILDLRGVDPAEDKPTRLNVWRPRKRDRAQGEIFHEALPATAAMGWTLPEISESSVRVTLATLATLASVTVLGLTLAQLLGGGAGAQSQAGESQRETVQTSTPSSEPSVAVTNGDTAASTTHSAQGTRGGPGGGSASSGTASDPGSSTATPNTDPMVLVETPLGVFCVRANALPPDVIAKFGPC